MSFVITLERKLIHNCLAKGLCIEIAHSFGYSWHTQKLGQKEMMTNPAKKTN